ncbi:carbohydrate kinase family protein [Pedobacter sp.]|uniref:carbohydrate kinase family protein n=1 Tax=Pedobacter sp. TaxID=1411316 RepID=UPI003D7F9B0B
MQKKNTVLCFGEILWDNLPDGKKPGGAPMNVAYHLHQLGIDSRLLSSVGHDEPGKELLAFLQEMGLDTQYIQIDEQHDTSQVQATIEESTHEVTYEIVKPVAWDFINWQPAFETLVREAQALVFGTLSIRNQSSRDTLFRLIEQAEYCVFDVNLRAPHYTMELIELLLQKAELVKLNSSELLLIAQHYQPHCVTEADSVELLFERFNMEEVLITKGSKGVSYYTTAFRYDYPAYTITVADTIGSGDSFLAAFLAMKLADEPIEITLDYALAMGAFITSQHGACPPYKRFDLDRFIWKKKLNLDTI